MLDRASSLSLSLSLARRGLSTTDLAGRPKPGTSIARGHD